PVTRAMRSSTTWNVVWQPTPQYGQSDSTVVAGRFTGFTGRARGSPPLPVAPARRSAPSARARRPASLPLLERPPALSAVSDAGSSAPVGQACTHSPQPTHELAPIGSSMSNTIFAAAPRPA